MPLSHQLRSIQLSLVPAAPEIPGPSSQGSVPPEGIIVWGPKVSQLHTPIPGTRCPTCAQNGKEVWVIPGRCCGYCGTPCDGHESHH